MLIKIMRNFSETPLWRILCLLGFFQAVSGFFVTIFIPVL